MFCTECGKENQEQNKFCFDCGNTLSREKIEEIVEAIIPTGTNNLPTCKGVYEQGTIKSSGGISKIQGIKLISFYKNLPMPYKSEILFEYEHLKNEAYNIRPLPLKVTSLKDIGSIEVKGGHYKEGKYSITGNGLALSNDKTEELITLYGCKIETITQERARKKLKSLAVGAVGALATLGVGVVVGLMHASKKYILAEITLSDGNMVIAEMRPQAYEKILLTSKKEYPSITQEEFLKSIERDKDTKNIEDYFTGAKVTQNINMFITYAVVGLIILAILKN
jgi:hypothetical protein